MVVSKAVVCAVLLIAVLNAISAKPQPSIIRERHIIRAPIKFRVIHHYKIKKVPIIIKKHLHYHKRYPEKRPPLDEIQANHIYQDDTTGNSPQPDFHLQDVDKQHSVAHPAFHIQDDSKVSTPHIRFHPPDSRKPNSLHLDLPPQDHASRPHPPTLAPPHHDDPDSQEDDYDDGQQSQEDYDDYAYE